jgi:hypothetical protein
MFSTARSTPLSMTSRVMPPLWGVRTSSGRARRGSPGRDRFLVEDVEGGAGMALGLVALGGVAMGGVAHGGLAIGVYPDGGSDIRVFGR